METRATVLNCRALRATILQLLLVAFLTLGYTNAASVLPGDQDTPTPLDLVPTGFSSDAIEPPLADSAPPRNSVVSFFMHDILGGSAPSERVVAGMTTTTQVSNLPFSKRNGGVFPLAGGVPLVPSNRGFNNFNGKKLPFVTAGQLPAGSTLQGLVFGTITVIDDEITEGQELGGAAIGKAQGFHLASSLDGSSRTMAFTAEFDTGGDGRGEDAISFFGVHRTVSPESLIAVVGGTGKYEAARGYAVIKTLHLPDQHTTDGVETLLQISVHLSQ